MTAKADTNPLRGALEKLRSYNVDIAAGRINYRPHDHIAVADAALASEPVAGTVSVTDAMLDAHMKATGDWCEPFTAERESGVAIACDISQEDADGFNAEARTILRKGYAAALALSPQGRGAAPLDLAWEAVNALGGSAEQNNSYDHGLVDGIAKALDAIEKLGGEDPLPKRTARPHDSVAQRIERSEPDEGRKDVGSTPIAAATPPAPGAADRAEWQPIETAPRDGTNITVWHKVWKCPVSARYLADRKSDCKWVETTLTTQWPDDCFTHWQPLPDRPTVSRADGGAK